MENKHTEAPASNTFKVKSINGFEHLFTMRDESVNELIKKIETVEKVLLDKGWTPLSQNPYQKKEKPPVEYIEGKSCPTCQGRVTKGTTKAGKGYERCERYKYDFATKQATGCPYIKWEN